MLNQTLWIEPSFSFVSTTGADLVAELRRMGESMLAGAREEVAAAQVEAEDRLVQVLGERVGEAVVEEARRWPADLIVCGTHGRRGLSRLLLGSDAEYIVRLSPVPVLLVRTPELSTAAA